MPRDFFINGESMVSVKGGAHLQSGMGATRSELGLTVGDISVMPVFRHRDIHIDDFGPDVPVDVMYSLAEARVRMTLVHYDQSMLSICCAEAMAGGVLGSAPDVAGYMAREGTLAGMGTLMGGNKPPFLSGWHYMSLNISSPQLGYPWRFRAAYLTSQPVEIPLGVKNSAVILDWRAIPYAHYPIVSGQQEEIPENEKSKVPAWQDNTFFKSGGEILSSGAIVWDHRLDDLV